MKLIERIGTVFTLGLLVFACTEQKIEQPKSTRIQNHTYIQSKLESENKMDLYSVKGEFNLEELKNICLSKKGSKYAFYYLAVFDNEKNAGFPSDPFTAEFGMEEARLIHLKALYVNNTMNGFSELRYYSSNAWEGTATRIKL